MTDPTTLREQVAEGEPPHMLEGRGMFSEDPKIREWADHTMKCVDSSKRAIARRIRQMGKP